MDKRKLMQSSVASILDAPGKKEVPVAKTEKKKPEASTPDNPNFDARGRRRKPRTPEEAAARRHDTSYWDAKTSFTTSFVFDYDQYVEVERIANELRISKKACLRNLLALGLERFNKKGSF